MLSYINCAADTGPRAYMFNIHSNAVKMARRLFFHPLDLRARPAPHARSRARARATT